MDETKETPDFSNLDKLFTLDEAAIYLKISRSSIKNYINRGDLLAKRFSKGNRAIVRITESELKRFVDEAEPTVVVDE